MSSNFFTQIQSWFVTTEQEVLTTYAKIIAEVPVLEAEVATALKWVQNNGPTIVTDLQEVLAIFSTVGVVVPGPVLLAANAAVMALNAIAAAQAAGKTSTQTVVAGVVAVQQAAAAKANAIAAVAGALPK